MSAERNVAEALNDKLSKRFLCSVDGSRFSDYAFDVTRSLLKKIDHISVLHVYSVEDKHSQADPDRMREKYDTELLGHYPSSKYSLIWHNNDKDKKPVKEILVKVSEGKFGGMTAPDFLVLGYSGWRFHNVDGSRKDHATTAGSTADFALRTIRNPVILVKEEPRMNCPKNFVMSVNKSNASKMGLDILYTLISPRDSLTIININDSSIDAMGNSDSREVRNYYERELEDNCPTTRFKFVSVVKSGVVATIDTLKDYLDNMEEYLDYFCIAPRLRQDRMFSTLTDQVLLEVKANIVLCKV